MHFRMGVEGLWLRRAMGVAAALVLAAGATGAVPASADSPTPAPDRVMVKFDGRGWGHGVGMAQDGALAMGRRGATVHQILDHFYPGTNSGTGTGTVRVAVLTDIESAAVVHIPAGAVVRSPRSGPQHDGFPIEVARHGQIRVSRGGHGYTLRVATGGTVRELSSPQAILVDTNDGFGIPATGRSYRGDAVVTASGAPLRVVNELDIEDYLRGMGEVRDPSWPQASLQAQAVAARTYALYKMVTAGEICPTQLCQVYIGRQVEYAAMDQAIAATAGMVRMFDGRIAQTYYSANAGGISATAEEGFGESAVGLPYLRPVSYPSPDPRPWSRAMSLAEAARLLGYPGHPANLGVGEVGPSGRPLTIVVNGDAGPRSWTSDEARPLLGLRSNLFTVAVTSPPVPAPPKPAPEPPARPALVPRFVEPAPVPMPGVVAAGADGTAAVVPLDASPDLGHAAAAASVALVVAAAILAGAGPAGRRRRPAV